MKHKKQQNFIQGPRHHRDGGDGGEWGHGPPFFWVPKRKKENKEKIERVSKQKLLKSCHQGQNVAILAILERLVFKKCSCHTFF